MENQRPPKHKRDRSEIRRAGVGMMIPAMVAASIVVGVWLGHTFDTWAGTKPWGLIIGLALGIAAAVRETKAMLKKVNAEDDGEDKKQR